LSGKSQPSDPERLQEAATAGSDLRGKLLELATADETAYAGYQQASALPRSTVVEKLARRQALDQALYESTTVPLEIARTGLDVLDLLQLVAEHGTRHALSDVSTGAVLAEAAIRSALFTVRVNVGLTRDEDARQNYLSEIDSLHSRMTAATHSVLSEVENRTVSG
jgi:formiminotetrahydrofolate cyclodeaminase